MIHTTQIKINVKYLIVVAFFISVTGYGQSSDITLYLKTDVTIDSIFFSNITQDKEFRFLKYSDTIRIHTTDSINDLYNFWFYTKKGKLTPQLWLSGRHITIKATVSDVVKVDTVIGASLYYNAISFRNKFQTLIDKGSDVATLNNFLLDQLKEQVGNLYSVEIASNFFFRNVSNKGELKKAYDLMAGQPSAIRNHLLNPFKKIEKILTETKVDLANQKFMSVGNQSKALQLSKEKKYLLDFWFIGCAPCIRDHQSMIPKLNALKNNNVELIGISTDRNQTQWEAFLKKKNYGWQNLREVDEHNKRLTTKMLIEAFPTYLLIDSDGNILYRASSFEDVANHLKI